LSLKYPGPVTEEAHEIAGLLFGAAELTRRRFDELCAGFGMTPVQARALLALERPLPMRELAGILRCDPSNVTGIADRLESRGLVRRDSSGSDRRVKFLVPTPAGEEMRQTLENALVETSPFMAGLNSDERRTLRTLLVKINERGTTEAGKSPEAGAT
jgi:DNA-binding MarR family transcriptional regulator